MSMLLCVHVTSVLFFTGGKFCPDYGLLLELHALTLVARSYALLFDLIQVAFIYLAHPYHNPTLPFSTPSWPSSMQLGNSKLLRGARLLANVAIATPTPCKYDMNFVTTVSSLTQRSDFQVQKQSVSLSLSQVSLSQSVCLNFSVSHQSILQPVYQSVSRSSSQCCNQDYSCSCRYLVWTHRYSSYIIQNTYNSLHRQYIHVPSVHMYILSLFRLRVHGIQSVQIWLRQEG